jgi:iron complex transport system substrate-binding protein
MSRQYIPSILALLIALILSACGSAVAPAPTAAPPPTAAPAPTAAPTAAPAPTAVPAATAAPNAAPAAAAGSITDRAGRTVSLASVPQRIVSLAPSNTEILFALDLGSQVVATDDFSNYPAAAKDLPKLGGLNGSYNYEQIVALQPDLVLAAGITPPEAIEKLEGLKIPVAVANVTETSFQNVLADIGFVGQLTGRADQAGQLTSTMRRRYEEITTKIATSSAKPRVYWELDATDAAKPYTVGPGSFVHDLIDLAGGINIFGDASSSYPQVGLEQVVAADPEVIILSDAAYGITVESVMQRPGMSDVAAVKQQRVHPIDDDLVSRPGPRIVDGLEAAAKLIHPELFK